MYGKRQAGGVGGGEMDGDIGSVLLDFKVDRLFFGSFVSGGIEFQTAKPLPRIYPTGTMSLICTNSQTNPRKFVSSQSFGAGFCLPNAKAQRRKEN
jgi:hypothetical protein